MTNWQTLKDSIKAIIKKNGNQEITGEVLQSVLVNIISTMGEQNALCRGIATPTTNPGTIDGPLYYFATQAGTYANFDGIDLPQGLSILFWDNSEWTATTAFVVVQDLNGYSTNAVSQSTVKQAIDTLNNDIQGIGNSVITITTDVGELNNLITNLRTDVNANKSNITTLQDKVTKNTNNIADNKEQLTILADMLEPIPGEIDILEKNQINDRAVTDKVANDLETLTRVVNNIEAINTIILGTSGTLDITNLAPGIYKVYDKNGNLIGSVIATGNTPNATSILAIGNFLYKKTAADVPYIENSADIPDTIFTYFSNDVWYNISLKELNNRKAEADVPPRIEVVWQEKEDSKISSNLIVKNAKWYLDKGYIPILFRWVKKAFHRRADGCHTERKGLLPYGFQNFCQVKVGTYIGVTDYFLHLNSKGWSQTEPTRNPTYTEDILPVLVKNCKVGASLGDNKRYAWGKKRIDTCSYIIDENGRLSNKGKYMRFSFYLGFVPKPSKFAARITTADCVSNLAKFKIQLQWGNDNVLNNIRPTY